MPAEEHKSLPDLSIIIPTKDRNSILIDHLAKLTDAIAGMNIEIIVVNDSHKEISGLPAYDQLKMVKNPKQGVASARNFGVSLAASKLIMFMDDDMIVFKENIDAVLQFHSNNNDAFLNLNWVYPPVVQEQIRKFPFGRYLEHYGFTSLHGWNRGNPSWSSEKTFETNGITSQNLSVTRETFMKCGGYNEDFPHAGFEDHDFSKRIREKGFKIFIDPKQVTYHDESDRLDIGSWMSRKYRGGITRKMAVHKGISESRLQLTLAKKLILSFGDKIFYPLIKYFNKPYFWQAFDGIYFSMVNIVLSLAIYGGYFSTEAEQFVKQVDD